MPSAFLDILARNVRVYLFSQDKKRKPLAVYIKKQKGAGKTYISKLPLSFATRLLPSIYLYFDEGSLGPQQEIITHLACLLARLLRYIHRHISRYAPADMPCRRTKIQRNLV